MMKNKFSVTKKFSQSIIIEVGEWFKGISNRCILNFLNKCLKCARPGKSGCCRDNFTALLLIHTMV